MMIRGIAISVVAIRAIAAMSLLMLASACMPTIEQSAGPFRQSVGPGGVQQSAGPFQQSVGSGGVRQSVGSQGPSQSVGAGGVQQNAGGIRQAVPNSCQISCGGRQYAASCAANEAPVCQCQTQPYALCSVPR